MEPNKGFLEDVVSLVEFAEVTPTRKHAAGQLAAALEAVLQQSVTRRLFPRLQLVEDQQVHAIPTDLAARTRLARVMGYRDDAAV